MFDVIPALSRRISRARAHRLQTSEARSAATTSRRRTSFGESIAIGLGCDSWKPRHPQI